MDRIVFKYCKSTLKQLIILLAQSILGKQNKITIAQLNFIALRTMLYALRCAVAQIRLFTTTQNVRCVCQS
jgi:type III secretory pathway component EscU